MARAIEYLERAAEQALASYANHDAIQYVRRAFELGTTPRTGTATNDCRNGRPCLATHTTNWRTTLARPLTTNGG